MKNNKGVAILRELNCSYPYFYRFSLQALNFKFLRQSIIPSINTVIFVFPTRYKKVKEDAFFVENHVLKSFCKTIKMPFVYICALLFRDWSLFFFKYKNHIPVVYVTENILCRLVAIKLSIWITMLYLFNPGDTPSNVNRYVSIQKGQSPDIFIYSFTSCLW